MAGEAAVAGLDVQRLRELCGGHGWQHWFSRSQSCLIPQQQYQTLQKAFPGQFRRAWQQLKGEWDSVRSRQRSYFDNTHAALCDVLQFPRVKGRERWGHATPKPVALMEQLLKTSLPRGGVVLDPFGGSGSTLMAADVTGRTACLLEVEPRWCDVIVQWWEEQADRTGSP